MRRKSRLYKRIKYLRELYSRTESGSLSDYRIKSLILHYTKWFRFFSSLEFGLPFHQIEYKGIGGQCAPIAVANVTGCSFEDAQFGLMNEAVSDGTERNCGEPTTRGYMTDTIIRYLREQFPIVSYYKDPDDITIKDAYEKFGDCFVLFKGHIASIVDGKYCDTFRAYLTQYGDHKRIIGIITIDEE